MPLTPDQIEHKFRQHDSETLTIYDMLAEIKETVTAHDARFGELDGQLDRVDGRLDTIDTRLDTIDGQLGGIDGQLGGLSASLTEVLRRLPGRQ